MGLGGWASFGHRMNLLETCEEQLDVVSRFFGELGNERERLLYVQERVAA
jgi:hypothetical protein